MRSNRSRPNSTRQQLGNRLKLERERLQESLAEVSGAVEIDIDSMQKIERGEQVPSEEILLLLISHFDMEDNAAAKLWAMAGYNDDDGADIDTPKTRGVMTPEDLKIDYTDMVHIAANEFGVTMNFMQSTGAGNQPMLISRLGMSREHAEFIIDSLQQSLKKPQLKSGITKVLPKPKAHKKTDRN